MAHRWDVDSVSLDWNFAKLWLDFANFRSYFAKLRRDFADFDYYFAKPIFCMQGYLLLYFQYLR
ncbi:hypothetical protein [Neobacillus sp. SuZ13]|uniref:hypothetical protein n=1 Tax=Neobacillus sp. SuZ13 TaxID=3047875 RepID=UPI0024C0CC7A|nr:hypothetical protein [Neobacillus sp. SuZ13]WHY66808.1 hypothetical protein QNH17_27940 [Neobacillus sp. SuZ13]